MNKDAYKTMATHENSFWWYVARRKIIKKVITGLSLPSSKILEIGSGTGGNVDMLSRLGDYTGIEKESLAIDLAVKKNPKTTFIKGSIPEKLDEVTETYDLIALLDVIEHIEDDLTTLEKAQSKLGANGSIVITVPAHQYLWSYHDVTHHHHRRYSKKDLRRLAKDAGLSITYMSYYNFFLFPVVLLTRCFFKIFKNRTTDDVPTSRFVNGLLKKIFGAEALFLPRLKLPIGVSLIIILKKVTE